MRPRPGRAHTHLHTEDLLFLLSTLLLLTPANCFPSSAQLYVVCKDADSHTCVTWPVDFESATKLARQFYGPDDCGLSDLKPIPPHRKFIAVKHFSDKSERFFCNTIKIQTVEPIIPIENVIPEIVRTRRQANYRLRGRYRGQTQSQYLSIDRGTGKDEGKAEAHSAADSSRAIVSGNSGMGQAQSQTVYDPTCEDCNGRSDTEQASLIRGPKGPANGQGTYNPDLNNNYNRQGQIPGTSFPGSNGGGSAPSMPGGGQNINGQNLPHFTTNQQKPQDNNYLTNQPGGTGGRNGIPQYSTQPGQQGVNGLLNNVNTPNQPPGIFGRPDGSTNQQLPPENIINRGVSGSNLPNRPGLINQQQPPNANNQWTNGLPNGNIDISRIPGNVNGGQGSGGVPTNIPNGFQQTPNNGYTLHQTGSPNLPGVLPNQNTLSPNNLPPGNTFTNYPGSGGGGSGGPNINNQGNPFSWPILSDILRQKGAGSTYFCCVVGPDNNIQNLFGSNGNRQPPFIGQNNVNGPNGGTGQSSAGQYGGTGQTPTGQYGGTGQSPTSQFGGTGQTPTGQYGRPGQGTTGPYEGTGQTPMGQYGRPGQTPTGQYGGTGQTPAGQYGGAGQTPAGQYGVTGQIPSGQYGGTGQVPNSQHGGTGQTPSGQYGGSGQIPTGQYGGTGQTPSGQLGGTGQIPTGQYGGNGQTPSGQLGGTGQIPTGQYGGTGQTPSGQLGGTGQIPTGQYGGTGQTPSGQLGGTGQMPTGQYGGTGQTFTGPYGGTGQRPPSQYGGPTGPYGGTGQGLNGPYGGTVQIPTGQYGGTGQTPPGQYGLPGQGTTGPYGGTGQIPTGQIGGTGQTPTGQYGATGQTPTGQYGGTGQIPSGQYGQPGQGTTGPYGGTGQIPTGQIGGTGQIPMGQIGGIGQTPAGQYGTTGQTPTGQYGGTGQTSTGQYGGPGQGPTGSHGGTGQIPTGQIGGTGQIPTGQIGGTGQTPAGQYGTTGQTPTGQYGGTGQTSTGQYGGPGQGPTGSYGGTGQIPIGQIGGTGQIPTGQIGGPGQNLAGQYGGTGQIPTSPYGGTGQTPTGQYGGQVQTPTGQYGGPGQSPTGSYGTTGPGNLPPNTGPYGGTGQIPNGPYGGGTGQTPNGPYGGTGPTLNVPYGGTGQTPNGPYGGTGQTFNGPYGGTGQISTGPHGGTGQTSNGPYGGTGQISTGPYGQGGQQNGVNNQGAGAFNNEFGGNGEPQNVVDPNSISSTLDDYDSEAQASVAQAVNGTTALATSKGGNEKGRAQTQVEGTYSGTGTFSANAEISDDNKAAQSHVSGSKKGASSSAEGRGRKNKSQASVKLGSETGSILTDSQSSGDMHSSSSQVQGSVKGGMADAQAKGPGSTSSQAQIGFTPYKEEDKEKHDLLKAPFEGGGTASAQSSRRMGTSQSQLRGTFKYGISYNGAAQAGSSLDKDAVFSNLLPFDKIDVYDENNKNINVDISTTEKPLDVTLSNTEYNDQTTAQIENENNQNTENENNQNAENENNQNTENEYTENNGNDFSDHQHMDHHKLDSQVNETTRAPPLGNRRSFQTNYANNGAEYDYPTEKDDPPEEYEIDDGFGENTPGEQGEYANYDDLSRDTEATHQSLQSQIKKPYEIKQTTGGNTQHIILGSLNNHDAKIIQRNSEHPDETRVYQPGEKVPGMGGYTIPAGFTGSVKSVASKDKTYVVGSKYSPSQAQTVNLTPGTGKIKYVYPNNYGKNVNAKELRSLYRPKSDDNRYVSVSKSVTRDLDSESNIRKQYSHTYYTKSSSCGYFTFTCTMVSSAEGKKKVCKPKIPTNPDGTPMRC